MAKILFASNNIGHFPGSVATTISGAFASSRVPYGITLYNRGVAASPRFTPSSGTVTSFHFKTFNADTGQSNSSILFECFDQSNRSIVRLNRFFNTASLLLNMTLSNGSTTITTSTSMPLTISRRNAIDVVVTISLTLIRVDLYINNGLAATLSFASNTNNISNPNRFNIGAAYSDDFINGQIFSEILVADADTRNARLNLLRPASAGAFSEWSGPISNLVDDDNATGIYTTLPNQRQTLALSEYAAGASHLSNVVSVTQTTRGLNSPSKLRHTVRLSGVNYDSDPIDIAFTPQYNIVDLPVNPATSLPWTSSDLSTIETGFLSVA